MLPETNLGNLIALGVVAQGILDNRGLNLTDAVCVFLEVKVDYLRRFQDVLGEEEVYSPDALKNIDFGDDGLKANTWRYLKDKGVNVGTWCDFIRDNLSVICLSTKFVTATQFRWHETLLPDIINATPTDLIGQKFSVFYELHAQREDRGKALTASDIRHIKDALPCESRGMIDFILYKYCDDTETRAALNITEGILIHTPHLSYFLLLYFHRNYVFVKYRPSRSYFGPLRC